MFVQLLFQEWAFKIILNVEINLLRPQMDPTQQAPDWQIQDLILTYDFDSRQDKMFGNNNLFCFIDFATKRGKSLSITTWDTHTKYHQISDAA